MPYHLFVTSIRFICFVPFGAAISRSASHLVCCLRCIRPRTITFTRCPPSWRPAPSRRSARTSPPPPPRRPSPIIGTAGECLHYLFFIFHRPHSHPPLFWLSFCSSFCSRRRRFLLCTKSICRNAGVWISRVVLFLLLFFLFFVGVFGAAFSATTPSGVAVAPESGKLAWKKAFPFRPFWVLGGAYRFALRPFWGFCVLAVCQV